MIEKRNRHIEELEAAMDKRALEMDRFRQPTAQVEFRVDPSCGLPQIDLNIGSTGVRIRGRSTRPRMSSDLRKS